MTELFALVIACGLIALAYGILASRSIVTADAGNEKMQQIARWHQKLRTFGALALEGGVLGEGSFCRYMWYSRSFCCFRMA